VRIDDASGKFLAYATVNPHSLIFARATSRSEKEVDALEEQGIHRRLNRSWKFRESLGRTKSSFRLCFGEADQLPGLIIDAFRIGPTLEQSELLFVIQPQTAGAEALLPHVHSWIQQNHSAAGTVIRREAQFRKQEGLEILEPEWVKKIQQPPSAPIWVPGSHVDIHADRTVHSRSQGAPAVSPGVAAIPLHCDWREGQKTGFFLDQIDNVILLNQALLKNPPPSGKKIKVLDLCCYVGQWSAQLAKTLKSTGHTAEFTLVDISAHALEYAEQNVKLQMPEAEVRREKRDLFEPQDREALTGEYDIVICDPPALIKSRKHEGPGQHAYTQLHTFALQKLKKEGWLVSCSCSGLLTEEDFSATWAKAEKREHAWVYWWARGGQALDHPWNAAFPEGRYLKAWFGRKG
jgi:23S rRNA (cytosine1962-C5)-methyltransferase